MPGIDLPSESVVEDDAANDNASQEVQGSAGLSDSDSSDNGSHDSLAIVGGDGGGWSESDGSDGWLEGSDDAYDSSLFDEESLNGDADKIDDVDAVPCPVKPPERDDADFVFGRHNTPVTSCHINPKDSAMIATGSAEGDAFVWNASTGEVVINCSSVSSPHALRGVRFSGDGKYLAMTTTDGYVSVWDVVQRRLALCLHLTGTIAQLLWHPSRSVFLCAEKLCKNVSLWHVDECKKFTERRLKCASDYDGRTLYSEGVFFADGKRVAFSNMEKMISVYEVGTCALIKVLHVAGPDASMLYLAVHQTFNLVAASNDHRKIVLLDVDALTPADSYAELSVPPPPSDIRPHTSVNRRLSQLTFSPDPASPYLVAVSFQAQFNVWNYEQRQLVHTVSAPALVIGTAWDRHSSTIYFSRFDNSVGFFDPHEGTVSSRVLRGHQSTIHGICLSNDGAVLVTASEDRTARVFVLDAPER